MSDVTTKSIGKSASARRTGRSLLPILTVPGVSALIVLILIYLGFQLKTGIFLSERNITLIMNILPELGIPVLGVTILMIAREFDLSVGSVFAFTPMFMYMLYSGYEVNPSLAIVIALAAAAGIGFANGWITVHRGIPSFVTTLGMMFMVRSGVILMTGSWAPDKNTTPSNIPFDFFVYDFGPFRASMLWYVGLIIVLAIVLHRSNVGNWLFATGGSPEASNAMGLNTNRIKIGAFMLCSVLAGFAGILQTFRLSGTVLPSYGIGMELEAIAAAVIGGASLFGGRGTILGAVVGALLIRSIDNGFIMARVDAEYFRLAIGALTIFAVMMNIDIVRFAKKSKSRG